MIGATIAIGDFMLMLLTAGLWVALGFAGWAALGVCAAGGIVIAARRFFRRRP